MSIADQIRKKDNISTVFTVSDIAILLSIYDKKSLQNGIAYALSIGELYRISQGIYSLKKDYSRLEFANKYRRPSYISFYSILLEAGVVFQPYSSIFVAANRSCEVEVDGQKYVYRKLKDDILLNPLGTVNENGVQRALPERAVCDIMYLQGTEYFDNLRPIDIELIKEINERVFASNQNITNFIMSVTQ